ncbi:phage major capsid protein [Thioalkalivibrio sulfidiphilus]|uniref:phage major capsid protein n=1 Tax=Thioalkalivibrio sulfidiphilus TaxID=1033854 RepID=UPI003B34E92B
MNHLEKIYDEAKTRRISISDALERYHADQARDNGHPLTQQDMRLQRGDCISMMRLMLDKSEGRTFTAVENADYQQLERRMHALDKQVGTIQRDLDRQAAEDFGQASNSTPTGWHDLETGKPVNVYGPNDKMNTNPQFDREHVSVGDMVRLMVSGKGSEAVRNALSEGTDSSGGFLVPTPLSPEFIDQMRAKARVIQAGARTVEMDTETLSIARIDSDPVPAWRAENAPIAESLPTFGKTEFRARWLGVMVKTSRELIEDAPNAGEAIQTAITGALAAEWDRAALFGTGTAPEPRGLVNTPGVFEVDMGTNGAALSDYSQLLQAVSLTAGANAERPSAMLMHPRTLYGGLSALTASDGQPLMPPRVLSEIPMLDSSSIPVDEEHGTATNASRIVLGDFKQLMLGVRNQIRIEVSRHLFADRHQLAVIAWVRTDVQAIQPKAFAHVTGIIPS